MRKFEIVKGKYGPRISLFCPWSDNIERVIRKKKIVELQLNYARGWEAGSDLSFLSKLPQLMGFQLIDRKITSISDIHALSELRDLDINTDCDSAIDFSCFPHLESVGLEWRPKAESLFNCATLKKVFINCCKIQDLEVFDRLRKLEYLSLKSPTIEAIGNISALTSLQFLGIYNARRLVGLNGVEVLEKLKELEIEGCRRITDIEPIKGLKRLRRLWIPNNGEIASLGPVAELKELCACNFHESTNIIDGDLAILKTLPKLKDTSLQERKHYNCGRKDLPPGH